MRLRIIRGLPQVRSEFNGRDTFSANSSRGLSWSDVITPDGGEVRHVAVRRNAVYSDAGNALERFGDRLVRERTDVSGRD